MTAKGVGCLAFLLGAANAVALPVGGVVTSEREAAIGGASVLVWAEDALAAEAETDKQGRFAIAELPAGVYRVAIEAEGFVPHDIAELPVPEEGAPPAIRVELAPAVFIAGVVTDAGGEAVADAVVETTRPGGRALRAQTDAKGRFRLGPLADGDEVGINAHAAGVGRVVEWAAVAPRDDLRIHIRGGGVLRGRVVDSESGLPLSDFQMNLTRLGGDEQIRAKRFQSDDGVFAWEALRPGRFAATVSADGYQLHTVPAFEMPQDGADVELPIAMNPGAVVRGQVVDVATGLPVAGALVTAREGAWVSYETLSNINAEKPFGIASDRTDAEGAFVLRQLPLEAVTVRVRAEGYLSATAVAQPHDEIAIEISAGATVRGRLVDQQGMARDGVVVLWYPLTSERRSTAATAAGGFAFEQVAAGRYRVWGHAPGQAERWPFLEDEAGVEIVVALEDSVVETEVALAPAEGCDVTGTVRGLPAGELALVELLRFNGWMPRRQIAHVDEAGRFTLSVRRGVVRVQVRTSAGRTLTQRVDEPCVAGAQVDFHFRGRARLHGTVTRQGEPVRATVRVEQRAKDAKECSFDKDPPWDCAPILGASAATSPSGQYAIRGLQTGVYELEVVGTGHRREVRVSSDTRVDVALREDERQIHLTGVVTDADTQRPIPGVYISLSREIDRAGPSFMVIPRHTDANGGFSMRLKPGAYRMFANKTGFAPHWRELFLFEATEDAAISLAPADGAPARFTDAETGQPLPYVALGVDDQGVPLRLTKEGTAKLWNDLRGKDLLFRHPAYEDVTVPRWNGAALDIQMRRRRAANGESQ